MIHYKYNERQILAIMRFTGFTRQESIDYLNDLIQRDNKLRASEEQENKRVEQLIKSFDFQPTFLSN